MSDQQTIKEVNMLIFLYLMWFVFNGRVTLEIAVIGAFVCGGIYAFICRFLGYGLKKEIAVFKIISNWLKYFFILFISIIKSNLSVIKLILFPSKKKSSVLITFNPSISDIGKMCVLANSITITPGTYTVGIENGVFTVHCLSEEFSEGIEDSDFVRELKKMEEKSK